MRGLLVKDFRLLLQQKMVIIVLLVVAITLNMNGNGSFALGYLCFVGIFLVLNTLSYDEFDNGYAFLFTLPIDRKTYAVEKYVFGILMSLICWLAGVVITLVQSLMGSGMPVEQLLEICPIYIPICLVFLAIMVPFPLIFGREKGMIVMFVIVGIVVLFICIAEKQFKNGGLLVMDWIEKSFSNTGYLFFELIFLAVGVVLLAISCAVSVAGIQKKEF